jgi:hypothetical protein
MSKAKISNPGSVNTNHAPKPLLLNGSGKPIVALNAMTSTGRN